MLVAHAAAKKASKGEEEAQTAGKENADEDQIQTADAQPKPKGGNDAGIRKIRMGTFEDSGLCKGSVYTSLSPICRSLITLLPSFAFVDFHTIEQATAVLVNPRNHHLDGRKLIVEYASAEAVRRGAGRAAAAALAQKGTQDGAPRSSAHAKPRGRPAGTVPPSRAHAKVQSRETGPGDDDVVVAEPSSFESPRRAERGLDSSKRPAFQSRKRAKPGAALAQAQREKVAIVPSQGTRLKFT